MFKKLYHRLFTAKTSWQLFVWAIFLSILFIVLLGIIPIIPRIGISSIRWPRLFQSLTSYDAVDGNPLYVILYLIGVSFFSGLLVMILTNGVRNKINRIERGDVRYSFKNHVVFLGYNEVVLGLLSSNLHQKRGKTNYVILAERNVMGIRDEVIGVLGERAFKDAWYESDRIYILHGSRVSKDDLESIKIGRAKEVYVIGEDESDAGVLNLQSLNLISSIGTSGTNRLFFLCSNQTGKFCSLEYCNKFLPQQFLDKNFLKVIDFDELAINNILGDPDDIWPNYKLHRRNNDIITYESNKFVHLVVIGMNNVSQKLIKAAANYCHFPNHCTKDVNTLITVIDENMGERPVIIDAYEKYFNHAMYEIKKIRNGKIEYNYQHERQKECKFIDIDFEFIDANLNDVLLSEMIKSWSQDSNQLLSIYTCLQNFENNFDLSISLPQELYKTNIPIWVYAKNEKKISMLFNDKYPNLIPWGSCWEQHAFGKWDRKMTAIFCENLKNRNTEIPSYQYYQEFLDFVSFLSILHTSTDSIISEKDCSAEETTAFTKTEYYRNCARALFRGDDKIINLFITNDKTGKELLYTDIVNFDELNDIKYYYQKLILIGLNIFRGEQI